jgi:hypothetical protein
LVEVVERLRTYLLGWKAYFQLAQTPKVLRSLDEWLRHRLRALQLKHWRRGRTMYRELEAMGVPRAVARVIAANSRRWGPIRNFVCRGRLKSQPKAWVKRSPNRMAN